MELIQWLGTRKGIPLIRLVVTDGTQSMEMRPSLRTEYVKRRNFKKLGHLFRGKLNIGKRFTLLEYTTDIIECPVTKKDVPTIFYEDIRAQPLKKHMKSLSRALAKPKSSITRGSMAAEEKDTNSSFATAVKEMQCQLEKLKLHRSRLGY